MIPNIIHYKSIGIFCGVNYVQLIKKVIHPLSRMYHSLGTLVDWRTPVTVTSLEGSILLFRGVYSA